MLHITVGGSISRADWVVNLGYYKAYEHIAKDIVEHKILPEISKYAHHISASYGLRLRTITCEGHSLGGAIAVYVDRELRPILHENGIGDHVAAGSVQLITLAFAPPLLPANENNGVGSSSSSSRNEHVSPGVWSVANNADMVCRMSSGEPGVRPPGRALLFHLNQLRYCKDGNIGTCWLNPIFGIYDHFPQPYRNAVESVQRAPLSWKQMACVLLVGLLRQGVSIWSACKFLRFCFSKIHSMPPKFVIQFISQTLRLLYLFRLKNTKSLL